ncbi:Uncharacterized protein dnm_077880 [Desulfonema magnum]|uniref:Uncharacterized protein n=1 Tax=Desulfonema magnum TaxID=45655 RepID=A0A975BU11_9BACT|nr:Uncharacterized protein dnm_077880 [Desulfonema magnum]
MIPNYFAHWVSDFICRTAKKSRLTGTKSDGGTVFCPGYTYPIFNTR